MKIAIISDIHEDVISLKKALLQIEKYKCEEIICLGDISGFNPPYYTYNETRNANECLSLIRANCKTVLLGNHDIYSGKIIPEICPFFDFPENWYQMDYMQRRKLSDDMVWLHEEHDLDPLYTSEDIDYLKTLPEYSVFKTPNLNILFSHYAYPNISGIKKEFYSYKFHFHPHFNFMTQLECSVSFIGHSHDKGFYTVTEDKLKNYKFGDLQLENEKICIGLPPITQQQDRNGFCIFDVNNKFLQLIKL